ncbi:hypothetical protein SAMN04515672_3249 [Natronorubrum texcoconense]|uniref:Uncharacterized protein n=1 Tax=Natronorubrum texcoconense TaxID=1095776 RepID=A0A1G9C8E9_9EURY|nr:hypothetical protein SAMN04515672_3249 [Natronorubrum texcoconense]
MLTSAASETVFRWFKSELAHILAASKLASGKNWIELAHSF